jgi:phytoene dehydrogenase-like protein
MRSLPLAEHGLEWAWSPAAIAHPLDDGTAPTLQVSLDATASCLGQDGQTYRDLMTPFVAQAADLFDQLLRPIHVFPPPPHPLLLARFGLLGLRSAVRFAARFRTPQARALFGGASALLAGHATGWPVARGGSAAIIRAMVRYFTSLGGAIRTSHRIRSLRDLPPATIAVFDVTPLQLAYIAPDDLPPSYLRKLGNFRYGPGVFKVDWALDGPIPWRAPECARSATVHVGGTLEEIAAHEHAVFHGRETESPFVLIAQQSMFDATRAPEGKHTGWGYCHVPHGSTEDMTDHIERQVERFAPGFRDRILARHTINTAQYEEHNANLVGGDIAGGANTMSQFLTRPFAKRDPYATPNERIFLCSSSTPPGGGVHGMCGYWAAQSVLRRLERAR